MSKNGANTGSFFTPQLRRTKKISFFLFLTFFDKKYRSQGNHFFPFSRSSITYKSVFIYCTRNFFKILYFELLQQREQIGVVGRAGALKG